MNATNRYLRRLAELKGLRSDYAIAKYLEVSSQNISNWRHELTQMGDDVAFRVARELDIDPIEIISAIGAERAKEKATREGWAAIFRRVTADAHPMVFAVAILAGVQLAVNVNRVPQAYEVAELSSPALMQNAEPTLKIMSNDGAARFSPSAQHTITHSGERVTGVTTVGWLNALYALFGGALLLNLRRRRGGHRVGR